VIGEDTNPVADFAPPLRRLQHRLLLDRGHAGEAPDALLVERDRLAIAQAAPPPYPSRSGCASRRACVGSSGWEHAVGRSNLSYLASAASPLGTIHLRRRELLSQPGTVVLELLVDQDLLMSSLSTHSEEALARHAVRMRARSGLDVLIGGLGLGHTAREALASEDVARVEVIELLPQLIDWFESGLIPLGGQLRRDPRFTLRQGDVYRILAEPPSARRYDLILIDVDHAPEEHLGNASGSFYTEEPLRKAREHLAPDGILGVWSYAESDAFAELLRRVFREVRVERLRFTNPVVDEEESNWLFLARA